ncbi:uncharacterized protein [Dermacentor albipictus]|uniref:uncharacterized protein isoform X2 n=1 Tax=Dermacentor albipictus TaxID=60249 RepID=UPI0038FCB40A
MERRRRRSSSKSSSSSRRTSRSSTGSEQSNRSRSKSRSNSTGEAPPAEPVQAAPADSATAPGPTTSEARRWAPWRSLSVTAAPPHRIDEAQPAHRPSTGEVKYTTREDARSSLGENKYPTGDMARSASLGDTRYQTGEMTRSASLAETRYQTGERARSASLGETRYQTGERARFASLGESRYLTSEMARTSSLGEAMYPTGETARSASLGEIKGPAKKSRSTRRVEVTFSVVEEERVGETSSWPLILKIALVVGLLTVVLTAMFVLLMPSRPSGSAPEATTSPGPYPVCETADCEAHAKILLSTDPAAGNPCDDFGSFVCSAWEKQLLTVHSFTEQLLMASLMDLTRMKPAGSGGHATLEDRPAEFMALCATARPDRDSGGVEAFKEFLSREVNFLGGRAERTVTYAQLLEALVISSGKWLVPLWFQFDLIRTGAYPSFILIKPEPLVSFWRQLHGRLRLYKDYVEWFIAVVYDKGASSVPASYLEFLRNKSAAVQTDVLRWLSVADSEAHPVPLNGSLSDLSEFTPKFPGTAWAAAASKVGDWNIGEHHAVYVSSTGLLDAMNVASGALTARELLYHTVWWFVQQIGALTSNELFEATRVAFGKGNEAYQELLCGVQVSITYGVLLEYRHAAGFRDDARRRVADALNAVRSEATKSARSSQVLDETQRGWIDSMLLETETVVWPLPPSFEPQSFPSLYGSGVDGSRGFFGHWLSSREGLRKAFGSPVHGNAAKFYRLDPTSLTGYSPQLEAISVATAAFRAPFYYVAGTEAMLYGGLAFAFAQRLLRAMDAQSLLHAAAFGLSPVADSKDRLLEAMRCADSGEKQKAFPFLPAMALAYAAYRKAVNATPERRLKGLVEYTGQQIFFMTACYSLCEEGPAGRRHSPACSAAVRNFAPFSEAFHCSPGSAMNRRDKCALLTT